MTNQPFDSTARRIAAFVYTLILLFSLSCLYSLFFEKADLELGMILAVAIVPYLLLRGVLWVVFGQPVPLFFRPKD